MEAGSSNCSMMVAQAPLHLSSENTDQFPRYWSSTNVCREQGNARRRLQVDFMSLDFLQESSRLLVMGAVLGMIGYVCLIADVFGNYSMQSEHFPSTIAMLVFKWENPPTRAFFGFGFSSAMCLLISWYPYVLWNSCCKPELNGCRLFGGRIRMSWACLRWWTLPVALILEATVPTKSSKDRSLNGLFGQVIVNAATVLKFVGFTLSEAHTLSICPFKCPFRIMSQDTREYPLRFWAWLLSTSCITIFVGSQTVRHIIKSKNAFFKCCSLVVQLLATSFMFLNQLVIWWYCPERGWAHNMSRKTWKDNLEPWPSGEIELPVRQ